MLGQSADLASDPQIGDEALRSTSAAPAAAQPVNTAAQPLPPDSEGTEPRHLPVLSPPPALGGGGGGPPSPRALQAGLFGGYLGLLLLYVVVGRHWTDEGWYLNAARLVAAGRIPYLDFAFTQSPGLPYLYALPQAIAGPSFWVGRLTSLAFAVGTGWLTLYAARRIGGEWAGVWAIGLLALNIYTVHFLTVILTYPAATFFLAAALAAVVSNWPADRRIAVALVAAALATAVRLSAGIAFGVLIVYALALVWRRPRSWWAILPGPVVLAAVFGPLWLADPVATRFNLVGYHVESVTWLETIWRGRFYWANFIPGHLAWAIGGPALLLAGWWLGWRPARRDGILWAIGVTVVATTIVHALPENPQAKYQTLIAPWAAVLIGVVACRIATWRGWSWAFRPVLVLIVVALPFAAQILGNLVLAAGRGGDLSPRFSEIDVADGRLPLAEIEELGAFVRANTPSGEPIATLFTSIAVAADRPVLPGLEMSIFALSRESPEAAARVRLLTPGALRAAIAAGRPSAVILEQFGRADVSEGHLRDHYCLALRATEIGQYRETVDVYLRRSDGRCPAS